jgi:ATP-binding cassette subfamily B protein
VELRGVSFRYVKDRPLIEGLNLRARPGERVAIVGPTGSGKTTLINLLMRFYDPDAGEILVDGLPARRISRDSLRRQFGMVLQDTWLREGTIRENIAYGRPDAPPEEIEEAARSAHADGFIRRLPEGYDNLVREEGEGISQGQRQLLCIARAMLTAPPMLILDEATSSIDALTERRVQRAFQRIMRGRTSFVVAHRLQTIREADVILVMDRGRVIEQGTHDQLIEKGGFYAKLYASQFSA